MRPFSTKDEWYFNMRWRENSKGITPILVATPSDAVRKGPYVHPKGPYDHIVAASGREETTMWTYERPGGGRGFGFTGGHTHANTVMTGFTKGESKKSATAWLRAKVSLCKSRVGRYFMRVV